MDRTGLADFLRRRRSSLQPEDVGLPRGQRRRTAGLRREEVAVLCHMSTDYYSRLEQERGPRPSEQMVAAMAQGLHLTRDERDHLFRLVGHAPPTGSGAGLHLSPGVLRILDRLDDTPAEVVSELGETLRQNRLGRALTGDSTRFEGWERSLPYRWFTRAETRRSYHPDEHEHLSRLFTSQARAMVTRRGPGSRAEAMATALRTASDEFATLWERHEIGVRPRGTKSFLHPEVGRLDLTCQTLLDPEDGHSLLVYTAIPGTESHERLQLLDVLASPAGV